MRLPSLLLLTAVTACTAPMESESESLLCEQAAEYTESCLPGLVASRPETCGVTEAERSEWVLAQSCSTLLAQAGDGKADGVPALRGIRIRKSGNRTYFMIPLAQTVGSERARLFDETIDRFTTRMGELNSTLIARGIDLSAVLTGDVAREFTDNYVSVVDQLLGSDVDEDIELELGKTISQPRRLTTWDRYVMPQAFIAYFSAKFSVNVGIGLGGSATVMIVAQPWLSLAVDHTLAQPRVVGKSYELDVAVLGAPNVDIGVGLGGGVPLRIGVGAVFGPLDQPSDVAGVGVGISGSATLPIIGGVSGKFITVLKYPPLFMLMMGYSTGTSAEVEIHGNLQKLLDLNEFLVWVDGLL